MVSSEMLRVTGAFSPQSLNAWIILERKKSFCNANRKAFHVMQKGCNSQHSLFLCLQFEALEVVRVKKA